MVRVSSWRSNLRRFGSLALFGALIALFGEPALAQSKIVPDDTLGDESSQVETDTVVKDNPAEIIEGGARRGANLFHSFSEFNVESGRGAYFNNPIEVDRIFSRVTGSNPSEILGTLGVSGNADLFLINPNGIIFGENARLDVGGSFIGTTANEVNLGETGKFSATEPEKDNLLTINPSALFFNTVEAGEIVNRSKATDIEGRINSLGVPIGINVPDGKTLALVGEDIFLEGGNLTAFGGGIELGSVAGSSLVDLTQTDRGWSLGYEQVPRFGDIYLSQRSVIDVGGTNGGNIRVQGGNISLTDASAMTIFTSDNNSGEDITIKAEQLNLQDGSFINSSTFGSGRGANLVIETEKMSLQDGSGIAAATYGEGRGGNLTVNASNSIELTGILPAGQFPSSFFAQFLGIEAQELPTPSSLSALTLGSGTAGNLTIDTSELIAQKGGVVNAGSFGILTVQDGNVNDIVSIGQGQGGNLRINASESIELTGTSPSGQIPSGLFTQTLGGETAGSLTIETSKLLVEDGAIISASTFGQGDGGDLSVTASDFIELRGISDNQITSSLSTDTNSAGRAGNITVETSKLLVEDGAVISASTLGSGDGGNLNVIVSDSIELKGMPNNRASGLYTLSRGDIGAAGNLTIATEKLTVQNGAQVNVSNESTGKAGNLEIAADSINLNNQALLSSQTAGQQGRQGNLTLDTKNLTLRRGSQVTTNATGDAIGGNIAINADDGFIIAAPEENSDITANATSASGGRVFVEATGIYGIEPSENLTPQSDITASSELGSEFNGIVEINTPDVDRDRDLVQLPDRPTETEIKQVCDPKDTRSSFVIRGSGGLPPSPDAALNSDAIDVDWVRRPSVNNDASESASVEPISTHAETIVEAQGWIVDKNEEIVLVADNANSQSWQNLPRCTSQSLHHPGNRHSLIASTKPQIDPVVRDRIDIERFEIDGNKAFNSEELAEVLAPFSKKPLSFAELLQARSAITAYYTEKGYITSGAYIPPQKLRDKVLKIRVVEGYLEDIEVKGNKRLDSDYFSQRINTAAGNSLQREKLLAALQLLQQDPLTKSLSAELEAGTRPGASILIIDVTEADSFSTPLVIDNQRNPSVGSFRQQLAINEGNLFGFGDNLALAYSNTEGSDAFDGSYTLPFNARNGTLTLSGGLSASEVTEEPFNQLEILGDSHYYELSLRQPLKRTPTQEFAIGVTASRRNSDISSLLTEFDIPPSELSPGADEEGETRVSALRFFQEWISRSDRQVIAARSQFNLGLGIFDATVNDNAPDSKFFSWQGQAQWTRQLAPDTLFILRGGVQLTPTSLLSSEQFGLGGLSTVRGYRQDLLLRNSAAFASAEVRLPILRLNRLDSVIQLAPFFDVGTAEDKDDTSSEPNTLASVGLGLRFLISNITARVDWGIPLISVSSEKKSWQENGLYFSVEYSPF